MKSLENFRLKEASQTYGIANTPHFLVRKLRDDPEIRAIAEECSSEDILEDLRSAISREPRSMAEAVRPYAFLVALWSKPGIEGLQEAAGLHTPFFDWYAYVAESLLGTFSPVQRQTIKLPGRLRDAPVSIGTRDSAIQIKLATK